MTEERVNDIRQIMGVDIPLNPQILSQMMGAELTDIPSSRRDAFQFSPPGVPKPMNTSEFIDGWGSDVPDNTYVMESANNQPIPIKEEDLEYLFVK